MAKNLKSEILNPKSKKKAYATAGVNVNLGNRAKSGIQALVKVSFAHALSFPA